MPRTKRPSAVTLKLDTKTRRVLARIARLSGESVQVVVRVLLAVGTLKHRLKTVHALDAGRPLCAFTFSPPADWPPGHSWVRRDERGITCPECKRLARRK